MEGTNEQLKSLEVREDLLKREKERLYNTQEESFKRTYDIADKVLDYERLHNDKTITFERLIIIILIISIVWYISIDKLGYYFADQTVQETTSNINHNINQN